MSGGRRGRWEKFEERKENETRQTEHPREGPPRVLLCLPGRLAGRSRRQARLSGGRDGPERSELEDEPPAAGTALPRRPLIRPAAVAERLRGVRRCSRCRGRSKQKR